MQARTRSWIPAAVGFGVIALVSLCQALPQLLPASRDRPSDSTVALFQRLEWITYDWRMRLARHAPAPTATNLAAVFIDDQGLAQINQQSGYYWPWPRQLFGRVLRELRSQGAAAVAFDIFFLEHQRDFTETRATLSPGVTVSSDDFFAAQLRQTPHTFLGCPGEFVSNRWHALPPIHLFRTNATALGYAGTDRDADGVLRRARPYRDDPQLGRIWHLGLRLAAASLGLDLDHAQVKPHRLELTSPSGQTRTIPLDDSGCFYIDWRLAWNDPLITLATCEETLEFDALRQAGETQLEPALAGKLVVLGSIASGSNVSDVGATPLDKETYLVSKHWNVANALLTDSFIRPPGPAEAHLLIIALGALSGVITWRLRALWASFWVATLILAYTALAAFLFARHRFWLPLVLPAAGALFMTHVGMVTWRVVFEQNERRRVRAIFSRMLAPEVVNELLGQERLALGGTLRSVTVLFADVRGFTRYTDDAQRRAEERVREQRLAGPQAEAVFAENARETLATVNLYLAALADAVKQHHGTLDKYIGDCVMAFWGAPVPNPQHAVAAVRTAIDSQRAIAELNRQREAQNREIHEDNARRSAAGLPPRPVLGILSLGTGINTGTVTVGIMGSESHILNYTVFGREVNLASRLEGVSGHGRIVISASTHAELLRHDPALAATCIALPPVTVKGITDPVPIFEVPWQPAAPPHSP
ncbi:MAG TPA: adenylate/guanylate cyclase domain-containing protein [Verrucomicrobiota bacterium]|nr:adenylate/guanylate cyclase domain-containing protein [Verrucomicrobiota bacterium]HNU50107.1 adenylate/guanylate cyclase domain-containing protein [Verrucomicrobiota bacterium]